MAKKDEIKVDEVKLEETVIENKEVKEESKVEVKETEIKAEKVEVKPIETKFVDKTLDIKDAKDTKEKVSDVKIIGDVDAWKLLCKASSESQGWMKSTKVMNVEHGCLIQISTQQKNTDGSYAIAEALQYVPSICINDEGKLDKIVRL